MSMKKKMGTSILAGALGLSLIGGGTWAAFNDVETTQNSLANGVLDLEFGEKNTVDFELRNLKPGDHFTKTLHLVHGDMATLDINQILVTTKSLGTWEDKNVLGLEDGSNTEKDFLSQFEVRIEKDGSHVWTTTLDNLVDAGPRDITLTDNETVGMAIGDSVKYDFTVTFKDDPTRLDDSRYFEQNKYQGEEASFEMVFEATQMPGEERFNGDDAE
ncbi:biofilm matrix protein CalY [Salinibacillus aidingensis]|uniref:Biofilm matrix protein CalY n=1 Tax=Salinibacillus aidingensis TaxID=237684 RepID=A0ABP3L0K6_9BACI